MSDTSTTASASAPPRVSLVKSASVCLLYAGSAIVLSLVNKAVLSSYAFNCHFLLLALQASVSFTFVSSIKILRSRGAEVSLFPPILPFSVDVFLQSLPVSLCFVANVGCSFFGLQLVSVPMFLCLRRTVTAFVMVTEFLVFAKRPSESTLVGVGLLVLGALVAGHDALEGNLIGGFFTLMNNILTTLSLVLTKRFSENTKAEGLAIVWYNALVAIPASLLAATVLGEFEELRQFPSLSDPSFQLALLTSMCGGAVITYAVALCTTINSPMATAVTGNSKDIVTTVLGAVLFNGFDATMSSVVGLFLSFAGAATYSYGKLRHSLGGGSAALPVKPNKSPPYGASQHPQGGSPTLSLGPVKQNNTPSPHQRRQPGDAV